jgi:DNA-binding transcriptional ArsR family regulator
MSRAMSGELLELVAARFKVLADPARLRILSSLRDGERSVSDVVDVTGLTQANVSKHLSILHRSGFVKRRRAGLFAFYALADQSIFRLCDMMCGRIEADLRGAVRALNK